MWPDPYPIYIYIHTHTHTHLSEVKKSPVFRSGKLGSVKMGKTGQKLNSFIVLNVLNMARVCHPYSVDIWWMFAGKAGMQSILHSDIVAVNQIFKRQFLFLFALKVVRDFSVLENQQPVTVFKRVLQVMGNPHSRDLVYGNQAVGDFQNLFGTDRIQGCSMFIEHEQFRRVGYCHH